MLKTKPNSKVAERDYLPDELPSAELPYSSYLARRNYIAFTVNGIRIPPKADREGKRNQIEYARELSKTPEGRKELQLRTEQLNAISVKKERDGLNLREPNGYRLEAGKEKKPAPSEPPAQRHMFTTEFEETEF